MDCLNRKGSFSLLTNALWSELFSGESEEIQVSGEVAQGGSSRGAERGRVRIYLPEYLLPDSLGAGDAVSHEGTDGNNPHVLLAGLFIFLGKTGWLVALGIVAVTGIVWFYRQRNKALQVLRQERRLMRRVQSDRSGRRAGMLFRISSSRRCDMQVLLQGSPFPGSIRLGGKDFTLQAHSSPSYRRTQRSAFLYLVLAAEDIDSWMEAERERLMGHLEDKVQDDTAWYRHERDAALRERSVEESAFRDEALECFIIEEQRKEEAAWRQWAEQNLRRKVRQYTHVETEDGVVFTPLSLRQVFVQPESSPGVASYVFRVEGYCQRGSGDFVVLNSVELESLIADKIREDMDAYFRIRREYFLERFLQDDVFQHRVIEVYISAELDREAEAYRATLRGQLLDRLETELIIRRHDLEQQLTRVLRERMAEYCAGLGEILSSQTGIQECVVAEDVTARTGELPTTATQRYGGLGNLTQEQCSLCRSFVEQGSYARVFKQRIGIMYLYGMPVDFYYFTFTHPLLPREGFTWAHICEGRLAIYFSSHEFSQRFDSVFTDMLPRALRVLAIHEYLEVAEGYSHESAEEEIRRQYPDYDRKLSLLRTGNGTQRKATPYSLTNGIAVKLQDEAHGMAVALVEGYLYSQYEFVTEEILSAVLDHIESYILDSADWIKRIHCVSNLEYRALAYALGFLYDIVQDRRSPIQVIHCLEDYDFSAICPYLGDALLHQAVEAIVKVDAAKLFRTFYWSGPLMRQKIFDTVTSNGRSLPAGLRRMQAELPGQTVSLTQGRIAARIRDVASACQCAIQSYAQVPVSQREAMVAEARRIYGEEGFEVRLGVRSILLAEWNDESNQEKRQALREILEYEFICFRDIFHGYRSASCEQQPAILNDLLALDADARNQGIIVQPHVYHSREKDQVRIPFGRANGHPLDISVASYGGQWLRLMLLPEGRTGLRLRLYVLGEEEKGYIYSAYYDAEHDTLIPVKKQYRAWFEDNEGPMPEEFVRVYLEADGRQTEAAQNCFYGHVFYGKKGSVRVTLGSKVPEGNRVATYL
jgi:hypothetical protein